MLPTKVGLPGSSVSEVRASESNSEVAEMQRHEGRIA